MNNILYDIFGGIISIIADYCIWSKLLHKKINFKKLKTYIIFIVLTMIIILNYYFVNNLVRVISLTITFMPCIYFLFKTNLNVSIITPIFSQLIFIVSEIILTIILVILDVFDSISIVSSLSGTLILNILIAVIGIIISNLKFVKRLYNYIASITTKIKPTIILIFFLSLLMIANFMYMILFYSNNLFFIFILDSIMCLLYALFVFKIISDKHKYIKVYDKYNTTVESLREYEDILNKYRISSHENKNQLLMIRNMTKSKTICNYIDEILNSKQKDDDKLILDTAIIPEGGLRGLIYAKLLYMKSNKINGKLRVDKCVKTVDLINVDNSLMLDICKIVGVFIDNSIDAVKKIKNRNIEIYIYIENDYLNISVSNNYSGKIDLNNIESKGYTTKGKGHGYGLSLVKEIIENNNKLSNIKSITNNTFTQILKIKM